MGVQYLVVTRTSQILMKTTFINPRAMCATICNNAGGLIEAHKLQVGDLIYFYKDSQGNYVRKTPPIFDFLQYTYASLCLCFLLPYSIYQLPWCLHSVCLKYPGVTFRIPDEIKKFKFSNLIFVLFVLPE